MNRNELIALAKHNTYLQRFRCAKVLCQRVRELNEAFSQIRSMVLSFSQMRCVSVRLVWERWVLDRLLQDPVTLEARRIVHSNADFVHATRASGFASEKARA